MTEIALTSGGHSLAATLTEPVAPDGAGILFIHGWRSSRHSPLHYVDRLAAMGFTSLAFDLPGMGDSEGTIEDLITDDFLAGAVDAYDVLAARVESVSVVGSSFGAYLAARLVAARPVAKLVLRVPADFIIPPGESRGELGAAIDGRIDTGGNTALGIEDPTTEPQEALSSFSNPVMIVESELDDLVLPRTVERYRKSAPHHRYELMKGFHHSLQSDEEHDAFGRLIADFLAH